MPVSDRSAERTRDRTAVILNAHARAFVGDRGRLRLAHLRQLAETRSVVYVTWSRADLAEALHEAKAHDAETLVFCGGDGTYGTGITAATKIWSEDALPRFAFGPGGTMGTVPRGLGLWRGSGLLDRFQRILHAASCSPVPARAERWIPTLRITWPGDMRLGFIFGAGLVSSFFSIYDGPSRIGHSASPTAWDDAGSSSEFAPSSGGGGWAAAWIAGRVFLESFVEGPLAQRVLGAVPCRVGVDGRALPWRGSSLILASVLRDVGLGFRVAHRAGEDPMRPHVIVSGLSPRRLGPRMPRVMRGLPIAPNDPLHFDDLVARLDVRYGDDRLAPIVVDGEVVQVSTATVVAGPRIRVLGADGFDS